MDDGLDITGLGPNRSISRHKQNSAKAGFTSSRDLVENNKITLDLTYIISGPEGKPFISKAELDGIAPQIAAMADRLAKGEGDCLDGGTRMLGWQSLPERITREHLDAIMSAAGELSGKIDAYVSLGIGGSYLGIEATFRALAHTYFNQLPRTDRGGAPEIYFLGQNLDPDYLRDTLDMLKGKRIGLNVISKSGTTIETAVAFRIVRSLIEKWAGEKSAEYIFATTDRVKGALRKFADTKGFKTFIVPDDIGGRFSVLSDVGLVGLAMAGINIYEFVAGFREMKKRLDKQDFWSNPGLLHAAVRHLAHEKGKKIEVVAANSSAIYHLTRWMEQLFPESEGHNGHGLWVSPSLYSEKLHASGQMVQQGERNIIETFLELEEHDNRIVIPHDDDDLDGLNYLSNRAIDMNSINRMVIDGPAYAHFTGEVPNMTIGIPRRNPFNLGQFYYMMEYSVALSGYLAGHNPFIQPGVEDYKRAMFAMLGKPGTEKHLAEIENSMKDINRFII